MSNETWTKLRLALPSNDDSRVRTAYADEAGRVGEPDPSGTTGRTLNKLQAVYGPHTATADHHEIVWQYEVTPA